MEFHQQKSNETGGNAFKEEDYNTYLMKAFEEEFYKQNKNQSNINYIYYIIDKDLSFKDRCTNALYMSKEVYENWKFFCDSIPVKSSILVEKAFICFMNIYPKKDILIDINVISNEKKGAQQKLQDTLLCNDLKAWTDRVYNAYQQGALDKNSIMWSRFMELCKQALTINNPSERLEKLMDEANSII